MSLGFNDQLEPASISIIHGESFHSPLFFCLVSGSTPCLDETGDSHDATTRRAWLPRKRRDLDKASDDRFGF